MIIINKLLKPLTPLLNRELRLSKANSENENSGN